MNPFGTRTTLRDQLTLAITLGVLAVAIPNALLDIVLGWQYLKQHAIRQGTQVAQVLAQQAPLALLYDSASNADAFAQRALSFPGVIEVSIERTDKSILLLARADGVPLPALPAALTPTARAGDAAFLAAETEATLHFVAPVVIKLPEHPFEAEPAQEPELIGQVRIVQSKAQLQENFRQLSVLKLAIMTAGTLCLLLLIRHVAHRVTLSLNTLSAAMTQMAQGGAWCQVSARAPRDLAAMIEVFNRLVATLQERERELDQAMADQGRLVSHLQAAREDQNRTIARELHDSIGGNLTSLKLRLSLLLEDLPLDSPFRPPVADLRELSHDTLAQTKHITTLLRPTMLDVLGLAATLQWLADEFTRTTRIPCATSLELHNSLPPERNIAIFRIVQEAFTNIARHAQCSQANLVAHSEHDILRLVIADNGCGLPEEAALAKDSFGLLNLRERALFLGASFEILSSPGKGVKLEILIPWHSPETACA